jgi:hypothetical protein
MKATKLQLRISEEENTGDGEYKQIGESQEATNWREEAKGKFVSFKEEQTHTLKFLHEVPEKVLIKFRERERTAYRWTVEENGVERQLSVTSGRLLGKLRKIDPLDGKTLRIEYRPMDMDYDVQVVKG